MVFNQSVAGVCAMRSSLVACRLRVGALEGVIAPLGGVKAAALGPVVARVQTHWVKNAENVLFWLNGSALWRMWSLAMARCPHVDPLVGVVNRYAARRTASRSVNNTSLSPPGNADQPRGGLRTGCACRLCVARPGPMRDSRRVRRA